MSHRNDTIEYEAVSKEGAAITKGLMEVYKRLGRPQDVSTNTGWVMVDSIVQVWSKCYPHEVASWKHDRDIDLSSERSIKDHLKGGTYNPVTFPPTLFLLLKAIFPEMKLNDKKFHHQLVQRYPLFKTTNYKI